MNIIIKLYNYNSIRYITTKTTKTTNNKNINKKSTLKLAKLSKNHENIISSSSVDLDNKINKVNNINVDIADNSKPKLWFQISPNSKRQFIDRNIDNSIKCKIIDQNHVGACLEFDNLILLNKFQHSYTFNSYFYSCQIPSNSKLTNFDTTRTLVKDNHMITNIPTAKIDDHSLWAFTDKFYSEIFKEIFTKIADGLDAVVYSI